jgi:MFS family permease
MVPAAPERTLRQAWRGGAWRGGAWRPLGPGDIGHSDGMPDRSFTARYAEELVSLRALGVMLVRGSVNGAVFPFATVLLIEAGLEPAWIGPLAALAAVATLLCAPAWGRLGDLEGRRRMLAAAFLVAAPVALAHASGVVPVLAAAYLAWAAISSAFIPLTDSLVLARLGGSRSRFARARVGASVAYMLVVVLVGATVTYTGLGGAAPGVIGSLLCLAGVGIVAARLRGELRTGTGVAAATVGQARLLAGALAGVRRHRWFLLGLAVTFAGANAPAIFTGPRVAEVGGSGWEVGLAIAAGTLVEIPAFLLLPWLLAGAGSRGLFLVGGLLLGVAGILTAVAPTPELLIAARLLFGAGFAWVMITSLGAITGAASRTEHAVAAALHFAASAAGSLLVALAGVPLVGITGSVSAVLAAAALGAPVGALVALRAWPAVSGARPPG